MYWGARISLGDERGQKGWLTRLNDGDEYRLVHPFEHIVERANQKSIDVGNTERYKKLSTPGT